MKLQILQLAYDVLAILIPALVGLGIAWLYKRLGVEGMAKLQQQLETKQALAIAAVRFAEQVYYALDGQEKYGQAAFWLSTVAAGYGLDVSDAEIKGLIESALRTLKDEFADQWARPPAIPFES